MIEQTLPTLNYVIRGQGTPVLLIHGLFGSLENLNMLARALEKQYQVISIDVRNHGKSFQHPSMNYNDLANDVLHLLERLNIAKLAILGHSMGGKIAMQFALNHPEMVTKLIIADIAPVLYPPQHNQIIAGLQSIDIEHINNRQDADLQLAKYVDEPGIRQFLLKNLAKSADGFVWRAHIEFIANDYQNIAQGQQSDSPYLGDTLFIKGGNSDYIKTEHRSQIGALFPKAKARIIQGAGHWLHAEKPQPFNKIVSDFLSN